ncbi:VOC family protein [Intrasporangium oryzae]|nr:VOC family protein [Intrasporangium oryzae]
MAIATYKDLCIDAAEPHALGAFWAGLLGWELNRHDDGDASLREGERVHVWLNRVPEPKTVKNRLHIDVDAESLDRATAAGATVQEELERWTVLRDPDGQEFCVFVRDEPVTRRFYELVWDITGGPDDAGRAAAWWSEVLGGRTGEQPGEFSWVEQVDGAPFESMVFVPVPEAKTTKNRVHIDVTTDDVRPLVALGARVLRGKGDGGLRWHVMADPEGNEFCAFTPD